MPGTKKSARKRFSIVFTLALICLVTAAIIPGVMGVSTVDLGSAGNFTILAESAITDTPTSHIAGNVGLSPTTGAAITGFTIIGSTCPEVTGTIYTVDAAGPACRVIDPVLLAAAVTDMEAAYTDASGRPADVTVIGAASIGGQTITPGVHKWTGGVTIPTDVTLSGGPDDVWIFQIAGTLGSTSATNVILNGGARAQNIFWVVAEATTLGEGSGFNGTILDATAITLNNGAILHGRALAQSAVTLYGNTVSPPPRANFTFTPESGPAYLHVAFTDTSTSAVTIASRAWTFGDGGSSSDPNPVHTYTIPGSYTVTLTVTDVNGGSDTKTQTVLVTQPSLEITLINVPISLTLTPGAITTDTTSQFSVTSTTDWQVTAKDTDGTTNGYMTNYSVSGSTYGSPATMLNQPFKVLDFAGSYVALPSGAEAPVVLKTGTPAESGTEYPLGVQQDIKLTDPRLPGSNVYRIVVTLTVGSL